MRETALHATQHACQAVNPTPQDAVSHKCSICEEEFSTYQQWAVHESARHGNKRTARTYAHQTADCPICLQKFANSPKLIDHWTETSDICYLNVLFFCDRMSNEEVQRLDAADANLIRANKKSGHRGTHSFQPTLQAYGPARPIFAPADHSRLSRHIPLCRALQHALEVPIIPHGRLGGIDTYTLETLMPNLIDTNSEAENE